MLGSEKQQRASAMAEEGSAIAETDSAGVEADREALSLTPEEARIARENLTAVLKTHQRLEVRVMPRPKELDPRQQFEWIQR